MKANSEIINLITNLIPEEFYVEADSTMSLIDKETKDQIIKLFDIDYISKEVIKSKLENNSTEQINNIKSKIFELLKPKKLTIDQIEFILNLIPEPLGAIKETRQIARFQIIETVRYRLEKINITPAGIPDLIKKIKKKFITSLIEPASSVGVWCSEAISAPITQMTLNSVVSETQIVICDKQSKQSQVVEIGKWIDSLLESNQEKILRIPENRTEYLELQTPVLIPSTTCDGETEWMELTAVTRHLPVGDLIKIKTKSGREVTATSQKSFLVYDLVEDRLVEKNGKDLMIGDLVGIHLKVDKTEFIHQLDLKNYLSPSQYLYGSEVTKFKNQYENDKGDKRQVPSNWWCIHRNKTFTLPFNRNDSIIVSVYNKDFKNGIIYPKNNGGHVVSEIPEVFQLDRELGYIMGLYLSDGYANKTQLIFSKNNPTVLKPVEEWCKKYSIGFHYQIQNDKNFKGATTTDLRLHSTLLAGLFIKMMNVGSANKNIPNEALNGPVDFIVGILDGYFSGDGTINKKNGSVKASSVSKSLIWGINFLLARLGIMAKISGSQQMYNNLNTENILYMHHLTISNGHAQLFGKKIKLANDKKQKILEEITLKKEYRHEIGKYYEKWEDIILDPIVLIETVDSTNKNVYDVTVPKSLNFNSYLCLALCDTFHQSGSSKNVSAGLEALRELFNVSETRKHYNMTIQLKTKNYTYDDIFKFRELFSEINMIDIIKDVAVLSKEKEDIPPWTSLYLMIAQKTLPETEYFLRIKLDVNMLLAYKISLESIIEKIDSISCPPNLVFVPSPISIGIIDIYPDENSIKSCVFEQRSLERVTSKRTAASDSEKANINLVKDSKPDEEGGSKKEKSSVSTKEIRFVENASLLFLQIILIPYINKIFISGIQDIKSVFPTFMPIYSIVLEEVWIKDKWFLILSNTHMRKTGVSRKDLKKLLEYVKIKIYDENEIGIFVETNEKDEKGKFKKPSQIINSLLSIAEKEAEEMEEKMVKSDVKGYIHPPNELERLAKYWFAETNGRNFYKIIENEEVDPLTTFTNDIHDTAKVLGIEAARNLLQIEFRNIILGTEEYINSRHILLLVDLMTSNGRITSINFIGAKKMQRGALTLATFEQSMNVFQNAASFGMKEDINTVSTNIMTGKAFGNGTGFVNVITKEDYVENLEDIRKGYIIKEDELDDEVEVDLQEIEKNYELVVEGEEPVLDVDFQPIYEKKEEKYVSTGVIEDIERIPFTIEKEPTDLDEIIKSPVTPEISKESLPQQILPTLRQSPLPPQISPTPVITPSIKAAISKVNEGIPIVAEVSDKNKMILTEKEQMKEDKIQAEAIEGSVERTKISLKPPTIKRKPVETIVEEEQRPKLIVPSIKKSMLQPKRITSQPESIVTQTTEEKMSHHSSLLKRLNERKVPTKITKPVEKPKQIDIEKEVLEERKKFDL
jgi:intein/homing endonuclease